jgi:hypothetical protein
MQPSHGSNFNFTKRNVNHYSFLLAATSIKEILIGTTHSGISYQRGQISGVFFKTTFWWGKSVYIFFYEISDFPEPSEQFFFNLIIQSNEM